MTEKELSNLLSISKEAALKAGEAILEIYESEDFSIEHKKDDSPLTKADKAAHSVIVSFLKETEIPILSEEGREIPYEERSSWSRLWVVDPLDGTKEFIKRNGEFTVNIALVEDGIPILGVVYAPVIDKLYYAAKSMGGFLFSKEGERELTLAKPLDLKQVGLRVVASRSHLNDETKQFLETLVDPEIVSMGSSLKFMMLAEGLADIYPRFAPTMEWDTAAAHAVLKELNYQVKNQEDQDLIYNKENLLNPFFSAH